MDAEHLKRILIVDDESDVTELLDYKFKQAGYAIRTLNDPLRAIGLARDFRPDLIILDVMMPELTGVQLLRMVRADALLQDTPVIFLTAKGETVDKVKGLESGADDYVTKPFDTRELMLRAQALLRRAKSAAAKPSTPASPTGAGLLRTRFIGGQRPPAEFRSVQSGNRGLGFSIRRHFHKSKSTGLPGELVRNDPRRRNRPMRGKQIAQLLLRG